MVLCSRLAAAVFALTLAVGAEASDMPANGQLWGETPGLHKIMLDKAGHACDSVTADRKECPRRDRGPQNARGVAWARWCDVNQPNAKLCREPIVATLANGLEVQKTITLVAQSKPGAVPVVVNRLVNTVDYTERGEYRFDYIAQDDQGKVHSTRQFHMFIVDHQPPKLHAPLGLNANHQKVSYVPLNRYHYTTWASTGHMTLDPVGEYELPKGVRAIDGYDGDVSRLVTIKHTDPAGLVSSSKKDHEVKIDLRNFGEHTIEYMSRDRANFFGRNYRSNIVSKVASVHVYKGRVVYTWEGTKAPTPSPTPPPTPVRAPITRPPTPPPTPAACVYAAWGQWGPCSANHCGAGTRRRTRKLVTPAAPGGACGSDEDVRNCIGAFGRRWEPCAPHCEWKWGEWSPCNKQCGTGIQMRLATITKRPVPPKHYASFWSPNCPGGETRVCNKNACATSAPTPAPTPVPTPASWMADIYRPEDSRPVQTGILGVKGDTRHGMYANEGAGYSIDNDPLHDRLLDTEAPKLALHVGSDNYIYGHKAYKKSQLLYYQTYAQAHPWRKNGGDLNPNARV